MPLSAVQEGLAMEVKALVFDVFGTLVDWRTGVAREVRRVLGTEHPDLDGEAFAEAWRGEYQPAMEAVRSGARAWTDLDSLQGESLEKLLAQFKAEGVPEEGKSELVRAWHRLDAWPDVPGALARLRERFLLAPLSNAHVALSIALARRNGFVWDAVFGAEYARDYKPKPKVYLTAVEALRLPARAVLMVACHSADLAAAARCGLATAHVARPDESGPGRGESRPATAVDYAAADLADLAGQLGA